MANPIAKIVPGKGAHYSLCVLNFNIDIESNVCAVALDTDGKADRDKACSYCYAKYLYKKSPDAYRVKTIKESEFKNISNKYGSATNGKGLILRIGKNVECGHKLTRDALYLVLEYSAKYKFRPIITSKLLEFDSKVADMVIASKGIVHISLGRDEDETGAVAQGATNEWRLLQALEYKKYGCPTQVRIVSDVTMPMNEFHKRVYSLMGSAGILLTPLHYISKASFTSVRTDITWDEAKSSGLFTYSHGDLRPNKVHPDWNQTKEKCATISGKEFCNNCVRHIDFNKKEFKEKLIKLGWDSEKPAVLVKVELPEVKLEAAE